MNKAFHLLFDDEEKLMQSAEKLTSNGVRVKEVFSPFPIHGLDPIIGVKRTRLAIASFMYATTGTLLALLGMTYFNILDWPMNIGGKPSMSLFDNLPAFVPVTFEFSVFCGAHGMVITYMLRNGTLPGMPASNPDPRTTDDHFLMEITTDQNHDVSAEELESMIKMKFLYANMPSMVLEVSKNMMLLETQVSSTLNLKKIKVLVPMALIILEPLAEILCDTTPVSISTTEEKKETYTEPTATDLERQQDS